MSTAAEPLILDAFDRSHEQLDRGVRSPRADAGPAARHHTRRDGYPSGPESRLIVAIGRALGTVVVTLRGELTASEAPHLRAIFDDLINNQGNLDVVVDLPHLSHADPSGLAVLAAAADWAVNRRAAFRLSRPSPPLGMALEAAGLAQDRAGRGDGQSEWQSVTISSGH